MTIHEQSILSLPYFISRPRSRFFHKGSFFSVNFLGLQLSSMPVNTAIYIWSGTLADHLMKRLELRLPGRFPLAPSTSQSHTRPTTPWDSRITVHRQTAELKLDMTRNESLPLPLVFINSIRSRPLAHLTDSAQPAHCSSFSTHPAPPASPCTASPTPRAPASARPSSSSGRAARPRLSAPPARR